MACLCAGGAHGIEPEDFLHYKIGNWHFRPHGSTSLTAKDNIFFRDSSAESETLFGPKERDVITQLGTGFQAALGRNDINTFGFGYDYLHRFYADHSEVSSGDHAGQVAASIERGKVRFSTLTVRVSRRGFRGNTLRSTKRLILLSDQLRVSGYNAQERSLPQRHLSMTDQVDSQFNDIEFWNVAGGYGFGYSEKFFFCSDQLRGTDFL